MRFSSENCILSARVQLFVTLGENLENLAPAVLCPVLYALMPEAGYRYACYKAEKKNIDRPEKTGAVLLQWGSVAAFATLTVFLIFMTSAPAWKMLFFVLFGAFAIMGVVVDSLIRIIGNEMLVVMLCFGIVYRVMDGGWHSALTAFVGVAFTTAFFAIAGVVVYLHKGVRGVGMGDVKLALVVAFTAGWPGTVYFALGTSAAMLLYVLYQAYRNRYQLHMIFDVRNRFPMCLPIMTGFICSLICSLTGWSVL